MTTPIEVRQNHRKLSDFLRQIIKYRELLIVWTTREIKARYRQSALGFGWALIQPIFQMVVISIVFGNFLQVPSEGIPYPVFAYVAILPWSLFAGSINSAVPSIMTNMELVTKIYFPREILPLSSIMARLVDFAIASLVFVGLIIWYKIPIYPTLLYVPLLLVIQMILAVGVGLLGAAISVYLRDVSFAVPLAMQIWMYLTPVIYPLSEVPENLRTLYLLNPMAGIINSYRQVVLKGEQPDLGVLGISAVLSFVFCCISYLYFKRLEMAMADII